MIKGSGCQELEYYLLGGYSFGEQILDGIQFKVFYDSNNILCIKSIDKWEDDAYLCKLDKTYWMKIALNFIKNNDVGECPRCGNDINADLDYDPYS